MTDGEWILTQLKTGRALTSWDCIVERGCTRAPSRICDLRKRGHNITTTIKHGTNSKGQMAHWAEYRLQEEPHETN